MQKFCAKTISQALEQASRLLSDVTDIPRLESEILLAYVLQCTRVFLRAHPEVSLTQDQIQRYVLYLDRRLDNEPLPYITGTIEFYGMQFMTTSDVLIPRPETEHLVELTSARLLKQQNAVVLDVGTGSGCIAVAIARTANCRYIVATDISIRALQVARENAKTHQVLNRIKFVNCDLLRPIRAPIDVIVSNPPYIADSEFLELPPSVQYEPRTALLAGVDGLQIIHRLLYQAKRVLAPNGLLLIEISDKLGKAALTAAKSAFPGAYIVVLRDLAGLERILYLDCGKSG